MTIAADKSDATLSHGDHPAHHNELATVVNALGTEKRDALAGITTVKSLDDQPAIQARIDDVGDDGGGIAEIPRNSFTLASSLTVPDFVTLKGVGMPWRSSEYGIDPADAASTLQIGGAKNFPLIKNADNAAGNSSIKLEGLKLSLSGATDDASRAVTFDKVRRSTVTECYVYGAATTSRTGIELKNASEANRLYDLFLEGTGILTSNTESSIIENCEIGAGGIRIEDSYFSQVKGCQVYNNGTAAGVDFPAWRSGIYIYRCHENIVSDNSVLAFSYDGIVLDSSVRCKVIDNFSNDNSRLSANARSGILLETGSGTYSCQYNLVTGNHCFNRLGTTQKSGLRLTETTGSTEFNQAVNNDFRGNATELVTTNGITGNRIETNPT